MDPHRNHPDGTDAENRWYPGERGYPDPEWENPGGNGRYPSGSDQRYDDGLRVPDPRSGAPAGYDPEPQPAGASRYVDLIPDPGSREPAPYVLEMGLDPHYGGARPATIGPRSGEPLPPLPGAEASFDGFAAATPPAGVLPPLATPAPPRPVPPGLAPPSPVTQVPVMQGPVPPGAVPPPPPFPADMPADDAFKRQTEAIDRSTLRRAPGGPAPIGDGIYRSRRPALAAILTTATVLLGVAPVRLLVEGVVHAQVNAAVAATFLIMGLPMFALGLYALLGGTTTAPGQPAGGARAWLRTPLVYLPVALILFTAAGLAA